MNDLSTASVLFLTFIIVQRLSELVIARRNTARLMARGAVEAGASHYPLIVALHTAWVISLLVFGYDKAVSLPWLAVFAVLQCLRIWILAALGPRWTTRIIVVDEPLVARGPFRFVRHPNYMLVVAEILVAPMVLGLTWIALIFSVLNALVLAIRITAENKALAEYGPE